MPENNLLQDISRSVADTDVCRSIVRGAAPAFLSSWSGRNPFKRCIAWFVSRSITKSFAVKEKDPSSPEKESVVSEEARENIRRFIEAADFGELKEACDRGADRSAIYARMINEELWKYPAKVVCLLSILPGLANTGLHIVKETASPLNRLAPDLLTDVILSLAAEIDPKQIGSLVNEFNEMVRKVHTGSALLGEPGKPALPDTLSKMSSELVDSVDIPLLIKTGLMLNEIKEQVESTVFSAVSSSPELKIETMMRGFRKSSSSACRIKRNIDVVENSFTDEEISSIIASGLSEIDVQDLADSVSRFCSLLNRACEINPDLIQGPLSQFFSSLDAYEAGDFIRQICETFSESVKPAAPVILPHLVTGLADIVNFSRCENPEEMDEALQYLKRSINGREEHHE